MIYYNSLQLQSNQALVTHLLTGSSSGRGSGGVGGRGPGKVRKESLYRVAMAVWFLTEICLVGLLPRATSEPKSRVQSSVESLEELRRSEDNVA